MILFDDLLSGDDSENRVDERAQQLFNEFEEHFREVKALKPDLVNHRDHVFQAWTMQKIAGLQLCMQKIAETYNAHLVDEHG